jgi:peptidoglycan/xylan/chitin deacetylase (PgdA/CDA1 family)
MGVKKGVKNGVKNSVKNNVKNGSKNKNNKINPSLWIFGGLSLALAGAIVYAQSSSNSLSTVKTTANPAIEPTPTTDPLIDKAFREIYAYCAHPPSQPTDATVPGNPSVISTTAIANPVNAKDNATKDDTTKNDNTKPLKTLKDEISSDPCANFNASFPAIDPAPTNKPVQSQSIGDRLNRLTHRLTDRLTQWVFPPKPPVPVAPPLPPIPTAAADLQIHQMAQLAKVPILMYHDIVAKKEVFFDVTPEELDAHFQYLQSQGMTPISADWLFAHLKTGVPLPSKPVLLSFDDGYGGHYQYVFPLLKKYNYPGLFSIYLKKIEGKTKRTSVTWAQLKEMAASPLVTIASHSVTHPKDLRTLSDDELTTEISQSKHLLEENLGIPIHYFTYPEGKYDDRVKQQVIAAGYKAAFSMNDLDEHYAGASPDVMSIGRFGQSRIRDAIPDAWGGYPAPVKVGAFNFTTPIEKRDYTIDNMPFTIISGGQPHTIHADSRYQVPKILEGTQAIAGVDGAFFSLKSLNSNIMIGPVISLAKGFVSGNNSENPRLNGRPLALISKQRVRFIPFDASKHSTFDGIIAEAGANEVITDAFVGAAWLVRDGQPQPAAAFGKLYSFDIRRNRAFWGINQSGQPVIGVSKGMIDSVSLGQALYRLGYRDAIMVDSGASTSLAFQGKSLVDYTPRPVPHVVALYPPLKTMPSPIAAQPLQPVQP